MDDISDIVVLMSIANHFNRVFFNMLRSPQPSGLDQGLCYPQCKDLTKGKSPHRVGSFSCCAGFSIRVIRGKGVRREVTFSRYR